MLNGKDASSQHIQEYEAKRGHCEKLCTVQAVWSWRVQVHEQQQFKMEMKWDSFTIPKWNLTCHRGLLTKYLTSNHPPTPGWYSKLNITTLPNPNASFYEQKETDFCQFSQKH